MKIRVNFYVAEVKYTGSFVDYSLKDLVTLAKIQASKGESVFHHYSYVDEDMAKDLDGAINVVKHNWGNQLATIEWSYIDTKKTNAHSTDLRLNKTLDTLKKAKTNLEDNLNEKLSPEDMHNVNLGIISTILGDIATSMAIIADNTSRIDK